jgi:molecular chaperone GrpE (heat shock protein)
MLPGEPELEAMIARLTAAVLNLREESVNSQQHIEQELARTRASLEERFARLAADTQSAYQSLRDELTGENRFGLALLNALVEQTLDLERLADSDPNPGLHVALRAARESLARFGVTRYAPESGEQYRPDWHECVGREPANGLQTGRILRVIEPGYAAGGPERLVRRAKVIVSE